MSLITLDGFRVINNFDKKVLFLINIMKKIKQNLLSTYNEKLKIDYKLFAAHIFKKGLYFKNTFILIKHLRPLNLKTLFLTQIYCFKVNS